jgi:hypothetical protein
MQKTITKTLILAVVLTTALGVNYLFAAWTGPTQTPTDGNTSTPIHIGSTDQVKDGGLSLDGLSVFGGGYFQGDVGVGVVIPTEALDVTGNIKASGSVTAVSFLYSSDKRLKKNIQPISGLDKILRLQGVNFDWKSNNQTEIGLIAQDVEKVYPELVITDPNTGLKSIKYGNLVAPLIEAIKEQQIQINILAEEIRILKLEIEEK